MSILHLCRAVVIVENEIASKCALTSSTRDGKIFRVRSPSENLSKTPANPFMNEIFSSLVFEVKFERSKKFSVDIGREEKNG